MTEADQSRTCRSCGEHLPLDRFRTVKKGAPWRRNECKQCYNERMNGYQAAKRTRSLKDFAWKVGSRLEEQQVISLTAEMLRRYGGLANFCQTWGEEIERAGPGSRMSTYSMVAIARLIQFSNDLLAKSRPPLDDRTTEELNQDIQGLVTKEAMRILAELGYDAEGIGDETEGKRGHASVGE